MSVVAEIWRRLVSLASTLMSAVDAPFRIRVEIAAEPKPRARLRLPVGEAIKRRYKQWSSNWIELASNSDSDSDQDAEVDTHSSSRSHQAVELGSDSESGSEVESEADAQAEATRYDGKHLPGLMGGVSTSFVTPGAMQWGAATMGGILIDETGQRYAACSGHVYKIKNRTVCHPAAFATFAHEQERDPLRLVRPASRTVSCLLSPHRCCPTASQIGHIVVSRDDDAACKDVGMAKLDHTKAQAVCALVGVGPGFTQLPIKGMEPYPSVEDRHPYGIPLRKFGSLHTTCQNG